MNDERTGPSPGARPQTQAVIAWRSIWRVIWAILITATMLWLLWQVRPLVGMIVLALFFSVALEPGVRWLSSRYRWRRGAAFGVIFVMGLIFMIVMVAFLIPGITEFADEIGTSGPGWIDELNDWSSATFGVVVIDAGSVTSGSEELAVYVASWAEKSFGGLAGIASAGVTFLITFSTIATFTFYFVADSARMTRTVLSWFRPESQADITWTLDEAIRQTGGYFYSRALLMIINSIGFGVTMSLVGVPATMSVPLAVFGGFVSVFIPVVGTYLGAAVPIAVTLALEGFGAALILLVYVLVYQALENYWLSPKLSAETMNLNGATAFGAVIAGGTIAGPMGAFLALPTAALITSFITNYATTYDVVYEPGEQKDGR